jgi:predicted phage gp36 major capsid-like protein
MDRDRSVGERNFCSLDSAPQIRRVDLADPVVATAKAKLRRKTASLLGEMPLEPTSRDATLVVDRQRVRLEHDLDGHHHSLASAEDSHRRRVVAYARAVRGAWVTDELAHAGAEHRDRAYVAGYDAKTGFDVGPEIELLRRLGLGPASTLVDLGAGTGLLAAALDAVGH